MTNGTFMGLAAVISAVTGLVTAIGVILVAVITQRNRAELRQQGDVIRQVEKQGNSASLELKRLNMVFSRRTATATALGSDIALANDAERVYHEAFAAAQRDSIKV